MPTEYDAFISYSHAADGKLAPAVQRGLSRLTKRWNQRQALRVFRDDTGLAVSPHLWGSIVQALDHARYFVLLASPNAAASEWVNKEVEHWRGMHGVETILPVLTDGTWEWDDATRDFTAGSTAVPVALRGAFTEEPRHLDLHWARDDDHLSLHNTRFRGAVAELAAPMHGASKEDLESEDLRQQRKTLRLARGAVVLLAVLTIGAIVGAGLAVANAHRADQQRRAAVARELAATSGNLVDENLPAALVLAAAAQKTEAGSAARRALLRATLAGPQLERSIRRGGSVIAAGDGSAFVIVDKTERDRVTVYGPHGRRRQVVAAPRVGVVSGAQWVQPAGPATRPTGLVVWGTHGVAYARVAKASWRLPGARLLSKAWPGSSPDVSHDGARIAVQPHIGEVRLFSLDSNVHNLLYDGTFTASANPLADAAVYSDSGNFVLIPSGNGLAVHDTRTGDLVSEWQIQRCINGPLLDTPCRYVLSDDGTLTYADERRLLIVPPGARRDGTVSSSQPATRRPVSLPVGLTTPLDITRDSMLATRRGGNEVALAAANELLVANVVTGSLLWRSRDPGLNFNANLSHTVSFVPGTSLLLDKTRWASALRDVATGAVVWEEVGAGERALSPNGRFDVFTNINADSTAIVDLVRASVIARERQIVGTAIWSRDETAVVTFANQPRLWRVTAAGVTTSRAGLKGTRLSDDLSRARATFMAGGKRLITSADGRVTVWRLESSNADVSSARAYDASLRFSHPASGVRATTDPDEPDTINFWGPHGNRLGRYRTPGRFSGVEVIGDGRRAVVESTASDDSKSVAVVDVTTGRPTTKGGRICGFDNYGPLVPSASGKWFLGLRDPGTEGSARGSLIACSPESGRTRRVRAPDGVLTSFGDPSSVGANDIAISDDGRWAAYTTRSYVARLQSLVDPRMSAARVKLRGVSAQLAISKDGGRAWVIDGNTLRIIDRNRASPDRITVPLDETVSLSNLAIDPGQHLAALELAVGNTLDDAGRTEVVTVLVDLDEGSVVGTISDVVQHLAERMGFSNDGSKFTRLVARGDGYAVLTVDVAMRALTLRACARSGGNLTRKEWKAVAPNTDYVAPCPESPS